MKILRLLVVSSLASLLLTLVACSSDSSPSSGDACSQAKTVADSCNSKPAGDSGTSTTFTLDVAQCQSAGDKGQKVAQCIVDNKSNCDCLVKCAIGGSC